LPDSRFSLLQALVYFQRKGRTLKKKRGEIIGVYTEGRRLDLHDRAGSCAVEASDQRQSAKPSLPTNPTSTILPSGKTLRMEIMPESQT
jgi:hypothetical protein